MSEINNNTKYKLTRERKHKKGIGLAEVKYSALGLIYTSGALTNIVLISDAIRYHETTIIPGLATAVIPVAIGFVVGKKMDIVNKIKGEIDKVGAYIDSYKPDASNISHRR